MLSKGLTAGQLVKGRARANFFFKKYLEGYTEKAPAKTT